MILLDGSEVVVCHQFEDTIAAIGNRKMLYDATVIQTLKQDETEKLLKMFSAVYGHSPRPFLYLISPSDGRWMVQKFDKLGSPDKSFKKEKCTARDLIEDILNELNINDPPFSTQPDPNLLRRNGLFEPTWLIEAVGNCIITPNTHNFPQPSDNFVPAQILSSRSFHSPSLSESDSLYSIFYIFDSLGLLEELEIDQAIFKKYLLALWKNYKDNPYHNFNHAVDVLQFTYLLLKECPSFLQLLSPLEIFSLLFAAICHDVGHTSFNNRFHVDTDSLLALLFNDKSVLENYHCLLVFSLLRQADLNFCKSWTVDGERWTAFRKLVIACILGTDMAGHFDYVKRFSRASFSNISPEELDQEDRTLLAITIVKCADISNVIRPFDTARRWGFKLICEFFHQGDWERLLGHQPGLLNDKTACDLAKGQEYFMLQVAGPLFRAMADAFPSTRFCVEELEKNVESWRKWQPETDDILSAFDDLRPFLHCHNHQ
jgi:hypothetical protein